MIASRRRTAERARHHLEATGPVTVAVGHRLSGRRDVLPIELCRELARARAESATGADADELRAVFDRLPEGWFFDPEPESIRLVTQVHRGRATDGRGLRLELPRAEAVAALESAGGDLVPVVAALLDAGVDRSRRVLRALVADSHRALVETSHPVRRAGALRAMTAVAGTVPVLEPGLPRGVLCWVDDGVDLDRWWADRPSPEIARAVASRLARAWLAQALRGPAVPAALAWADVVVTSENAPLLVAGARDEAEPACQEALERTLVALVEDRPEDSARAFLELFEPHDASDDLRRRLPMASPEGLPDPMGHGRQVESVMLYWRLAIEAGLRPRPTTEDLLGGLACLDRLVRSLDPERDAVSTAIERLAIEAERRSWSAIFDSGAWRRELEPLAATLARLPAQLDQTLGRLADGDWTLRVEMPAPAPRRTHGIARLPALAGALVLVLCGLELSNPWLAPAAWLAAGWLIGQGSRVTESSPGFVSSNRNNPK